ncbi:MAG TPA: ABC transporter ATP-binding protein [Acidimicrobiales bacterium]|nr:ABC transporter ATP-binding protein [Acidimicrobiales bacterium]
MSQQPGMLVLDDVSFTIGRGESVALVGESGSGKSTVALAVLDLLPAPLALSSGTITFAGAPIVRPGHAIPQGVRGKRIGIVFQDPLDALNPTMRVGEQVAETLTEGAGMSSRQARARTVELLAEVGIPQPRDKLRVYPHELSGGQRQRVMIAIALALEPDLLIADEPTTALDVTIQRQVIDLLLRLREARQMAMLFISHDLPLVAEVASRVVVLYGGRVMESGSVRDVYEHPASPYTTGLIAASTSFDEAHLVVGRPIRGSAPSPAEVIPGCRFHPRCERAEEVCVLERPMPRLLPASRFGERHEAACHFAGMPDRKEAHGA